MPENKTKSTQLGVEAYLAGIGDPSRRSDCEALTALMAKTTRLKPVMWGPSIVGFGVHRYALAGGKTGEICSVGFSSRKGDISLYGVAGQATDPDLLDSLGKYKRGKGCLYVSRLSDIDLDVLENLVARALKAKET